MIPKAVCLVCCSEARVIKHQTFSYWYCDSCKDEKEVCIKVTHYPKGLKYDYLPKESNDIVLNIAGVYCISYVDNSIEHVEIFDGSPAITLYGGYVQNTYRITDSDMPPRKPLQRSHKPSEGTQET